jgi:hypothetical protein
LGVGPGLFKLDAGVQRFLIAYQIVRVRLGFRLLPKLSMETLEELFDALAIVATERPSRKEQSRAMADVMAKKLSRKDLKAITQHLSAESGEVVDRPAKLIAALEKATGRLAFLLCDDFLSAYAGSAHLDPELRHELLAFVTSQAYRAWRFQ